MKAEKLKEANSEVVAVLLAAALSAVFTCRRLAAARNASAHELGGGDGPGGTLGDGLGANAVPALGNSWHHCVSTRLVLDHLTSSKRALTVTKSPISALVTCGFAITAAGLEEDDQGPADSCSASGRVAGGAF